MALKEAKNRLYMAIFKTKQNPSKTKILLKLYDGGSNIDPKYLWKAKNWIKHAQFLWGEKWGLSFAATHSDNSNLFSKGPGE